MKIAIIGAGAIGMHLASQLHMAGRSVTLISRTDAQEEQLNRNGLIYEKVNGEIHKLYIHTKTEDTGDVYDVLILAIKQTHLQNAIPTIKRLTKEGTVLLCFQNGLGHDEILRNEFPYISLFLAITTEGALKTSETSVRHTGKGETWIGPVGPEKGEKDKMFGEQLVELFANSQLKVQKEKNIYQRIWRKLLVNICINPLTAIHKVQNGRLIESPSSLAMMEKIFKEGQRVANSQGLDIKDDYFHEIIMVCRNTYHNKSSMLQDMEAGRTTEIEYINGAIKRVAAREGMDVPMNSMLVDMVKAEQEWALNKS